MRILIIEDDTKMRMMLKDALSRFHMIDTAASMKEAYELIESYRYDALLLDRNLSGVDEGMKLIPKVKKSQPACAVMIASAYGGVEERIAGLSAGADDYIEKPYDLRELKMRLDALMRRLTTSLIEIGNLRLDLSDHSIKAGGEAVMLSKKENDLLFFLASRPEKVFSRDDIAHAIYSDPSATSSNTIDVMIKNIRKKLPVDPIETIKGRGYAFKNV